MLGARYARLDELVAELDVICLALPLWGSEALFEQKADRGDETRVWLVNTARGTIADTDAVAEALESGHMADTRVTPGTHSMPPRNVGGARCPTTH